MPAFFGTSHIMYAVHVQGSKKHEGEELCNCEFSLAYGAGVPGSKAPCGGS